MSAGGAAAEVIASPSGRFDLPASAVRHVDDTDEEVFLLHTLRNPENAHGLGSIDSKNDTIDVRLDLIPARTFKSAKKTRKPTEVNVSITQNCTALRTRVGETGSVVWRCSVLLAEHVLRQLWGVMDPSFPTLFSASQFSDCRVLELGAGTGVMPACLLAQSGWLLPRADPLRWISTDRKENLSLIAKNVASCIPPSPQVDVHIRELDWMHIHDVGQDPHARRLKARLVRDTLAPFSSEADVVYPDLILCVDCVYNPALHAPLVSTLDAFCEPSKTVILLVMQLREVDNTQMFLEAWTQHTDHTIYHLDDDMLPPAMRQGYAAWIAWRGEGGLTA